MGDHKLVGQSGKRVQVRYDQVTGKLDIRQLYDAEDIVDATGAKTRRITLDYRDREQLPKIIQRERKRHGLPPLSKGDMLASTTLLATETTENPVVNLSLSANFAYLHHSMAKIAYELAFLWLGEAYLEDSQAAELRKAIMSMDTALTGKLKGFVGDPSECGPLSLWQSKESHHLAYAGNTLGQIVMLVHHRFCKLLGRLGLPGPSEATRALAPEVRRTAPANRAGQDLSGGDCFGPSYHPATELVSWHNA